jgi:hypothetical protein
VGSFHDVEQTIMAGYGVAVRRSTALGATLKFSHQSLSGAKASGWGLDLGMLQALRYGLVLGLRLQNAMTPTLRYSTGNDQFPRSLTAGLGCKLWRDRLIVELDAQRDLSDLQPTQVHFGIEGAVLPNAKVRTGFDITRKEFTIGLGYQFGRQAIDYAMASPTEGDYAQNFGYNYAFGGYAVTVNARPKVFSPSGISNKTTTFIIEIKHTKRIYSWELQLRDQTNNVVRSIRGNGSPPPSIEWDGTNEHGANLSAGTYIYTLTISDIDGRKERTPEQVVTLKYPTPLDEMEMKSL